MLEKLQIYIFLDKHNRRNFNSKRDGIKEEKEEKIDPEEAINQLDQMFKKTNAYPQIYYLPNSEEKALVYNNFKKQFFKVNI